jgi:hypothetical protein
MLKNRYTLAQLLNLRKGISFPTCPPRYLQRRQQPIFLAAILLLFLAALSQSCDMSPRPPRLAVHTLQPEDAMLSLAAESGFDAIVQVFAWRDVEPTQNQYHWEATDQVVVGADYYDLELIVRLDQHPAWASAVDMSVNAPPENLDDYSEYVERVVGRYRGRLAGVIIWNEPNLTIEWGGQPPNPAAFTELLCAGYSAAKTADPWITVVAAGLAPTNSDNAAAMDDRRFLQEMYQAGAADCFDVLAAHPYSFGQPPEAPARDDRHPAFGRLADLRRIMVEAGDDDKPVWITEMGWSIAPPPEQADIKVSEAMQADYLAQAMAYIDREWPWVELVTVWNLAVARPGDPFTGYSLLDEQGQPRPALAAWQAAAGHPEQRVTPPGQKPNPAEIHILARDVLIHLGDTDLLPPWWPLFGGRKPSLSWSGGFYIAETSSEPWTLLLELMQQNEIGATVAINGVPLSPDLPQQDFTRRWLTVRREVPPELLRPGFNQFTVTTVRLVPDAQQSEFEWDDFQIKNVRLVKANPGRLPRPGQQY